MQSRVSLVTALVLGLGGVAVAQPDVHTLSDVLVERRAALEDPAQAQMFLEQLAAQLEGREATAGLLDQIGREQLLMAAKAVLAGQEPSDDLDRSPVMSSAQLGQVMRGILLNARRTRAEREAQREQAGEGLGGPAGPQALPRQPVREALGVPSGETHTFDPPEDLGMGFTRGSVPNPELVERYPDSRAMAEAFNQLALNAPGAAPGFVLDDPELGEITRPEALMQALLETGHTLEVRDARYIANFFDVNDHGRSLAMGMWVDTGLPVAPGSERTLRTPAAHSQHEYVIRGPRVNADVSFYMGTDGGVTFRPMWSSREDWVGGRVQHEYSGAQALEALRLAGETRRAFVERQERFPELPYGGYFTLGVCNDSNAVIELALNGSTSLYPLTRELRFWEGPGEIPALMRRLPVDLEAATEEDLPRILGSVPETSIEDVPFAGLREDLEAVEASYGVRLSPEVEVPVQQAPTQQGPEDGLIDRLDDAQQAAPEPQATPEQRRLPRRRGPRRR